MTYSQGTLRNQRGFDRQVPKGVAKASSLKEGHNGQSPLSPQPIPAPSSQNNLYLWLTLTCATIFSVYWKTLAPSIAGGDSGELVAESCHLGTAHPPGYPLYTILNHAFIKAINQGSPAWRANLLASLCDVISAVFLFLSINLLSLSHRAYYRAMEGPDSARAPSTGRPVAAATATLLYAFSPLIWQYAVTAEVFALNNALVSALIYLTLWTAVAQDATTKLVRTLLGAFVCGLALCNQHTAILFEIPLILYVAWSQKDAIMKRPVLMTVLLGMCFFGGLLPYAYLPLAAIRNPRAGSWGDVTTFKGFIHHLRRGDYGTFQLYSGDAGHQSLAVKLGEYARDVTVRQGLYILPALALVGMVVSLVYRPYPPPTTVNDPATSDKRSNGGNGRHSLRSPSKAPIPLIASPDHHDDVRTVPLAILAAYVFYMLVFHSLSNLPIVELFHGVVARFWMQPNIVVFLWAGVGLEWLINTACHAVGKRYQTVATFIIYAACLALAAQQAQRNFYVSDQHEATYFNQYARSLLEPLPQKAVVLINYDMQWTSMRYLQICEGVRPDVTILHLSMMTFKWWAKKHKLYNNVVFPGTHYTRELTLDWHKGGFSIKDFLDHNIDRVSGIFLGGKLSYDDDAYKEKYSTLPVGLLVQFVKKDDVWPLKHWFKKSHGAWKTIQKVLPVNELPPPDKYNKETWESTIVRDYFDHLAESAAHLLDETLQLVPQVDMGPTPPNTSLAKYLIEAAWWMEVVLHYDKEVKAHVVKNLGLAYMHMVRLKEHPTLDLPRVPFTDVFKGVLPEIDVWYRRERETDWKGWATKRFIQVWANFLARKDAMREPDYENVKNIYEQVTKTRTLPTH